MSKRALKLFVANFCPYCQRAEIAALEKNLPYERVLVGLGDDMPAWYKEINPRETVPTLQVDGSKLVHESNLIAEFLDNVGAPAASLMGRDAVERHKIEFFMSQVGDLIGACYDLLRNPLDADAHKAVNDNAKYIDDILATNQRAGPFYCDDVFTMADIAIVPFLHRFNGVLRYYSGHELFSHAPHLKRLWAAAIARPSVSKSFIPMEDYIHQYGRFVPADTPAAAAKGNYILYGSKVCPFVDRARLACAAKGVKPHWVEVSLTDMPAWYKEINPRETVPTLVTPQGEVIHESQLIVQYLERQFPAQGRAILPHGNADLEYAVQYFTTAVGNFTGAMYPLMRRPADKEAKEEFAYAAGELEKLLALEPFGSGPFFGGAHMNAGDIALLPMLVRSKVILPEVAGFDPLADYQRLGKLYEAGARSEEAKGIFLADEDYRELARKHYK